ncbi:MAG TPA: phosphatidylglycerophosphatase A [Thermodesulfobacteriota bacterium]|nr:phosphatidylglycerophosphatase A [Thermodesulfobacteriota bacterium]
MRVWIVRFLSTFFYLGYSPIAPGTVGTLGGMALFYLVSHLSLPVYSLFLLGFIIVSILVSGEASSAFREADPRQVVVDEVCGYLVTMLLVPPSFINATLGFFLFRFFDVLKPPPVGKVECLPNGFGIVADDILAGVYSNLVLQFITRAVE